MLYEVKTRLLKLRLVHGLFKLLRPETRGDIRVDLIRKHVAGKAFADIGCMWGINGRFCFLAEEAGAKRVVGVDIYPASQEFLSERARRDSIVEFVKGDINLQETVNELGSFDVVLCAGVLYHTPSPMHMLSRLRSICHGRLILDTAVIPEMGRTKNMAVFYPFLDAGQRRVWHLGVGKAVGLAGPYDPDEGYANWFWGMSPSCVESMLQCAGFSVEKRYVEPFRGRFVCRAVTAKFSPVSGGWTTPAEFGR
jgi:tRNA (mo5U34)-methyltransferase